MSGHPFVNGVAKPYSKALYNKGCHCTGCNRANNEACQRYQSTTKGREYKRRYRQIGSIRDSTA